MFSRLRSHSAPAWHAPFVLKPIPPREQVSRLIQANKAEELDEFIKRQPDLLNNADEIGNTPLHEAIMLNKLKSAEKLLKQGALPNRFDKLGETPLMKAAESGNLPAMSLLLDHKASHKMVGIYNNATILQTTLRRGDDGLPIVKRILEDTPNVNKTDSFGGTPLMTALRFNAPRATKLLLEKGAEVNKSDVSGRTPLMHATQSPLLTRMLLEKGADPNYFSEKLQRDVMGEAVWAEQLGTVRALAEFKAEIKPEHLRLAKYSHNPNFATQLTRLAQNTRQTQGKPEEASVKSGKEKAKA